MIDPNPTNIEARIEPSIALDPHAERVTAPERTPGETRLIVLPSQLGGVPVTEETAIQISAVWACVAAISKAIASSSWEVFVEDLNGDREFRRNSRLFRLLNVAPNAEMTAFEFREAIVVAAALFGNGYAEIERNASGQAVALWIIHPDRVCPERTVAGELVYRVSNPVGPQVFIPARDMFHIHGPSIDGIVGYQVTRVAARAFGLAIAAESFGASFFGTGITPGLVLETEKTMDQDQVNELRKQIRESHGGPNKSFETMVLSGGLKARLERPPPRESQFIEARQHMVEEIARWFGVPPHKIQHLLRSTFNNIEEQGLEFVRDGLTPWAERLRQQADAKLLPSVNRTIRTRLDLDWLAEGNAKSRAEADSTLVNASIITPNEARRRRGMNALPEGDKLINQANMTTLENIVEGPAEPAEPETSDPPDDDAPENRPPLTVVENSDWRMA